MSNNLKNKIQAILFYKGEPTDMQTLQKMTGASASEVEDSIQKLSDALEGQGICLLQNGNEVMLGTAPAFSDLIEQFIKEELHKDLGKAGLETLAIVLYLGPITRARIDYIRGVNSTFILRNLGTRGLVERAQNPDDSRSFLYQPTFDLLSHLGVTQVEQLPEYESVRQEITLFEEKQKQEDETES